MPSSEASLRLQRQVDPSPSTRHQTLCDLLNLYLQGSTDHTAWTREIEQHPQVFADVIQAIQPASLVDWSDGVALDQLASLVLAQANRLIDAAAASSHPSAALPSPESVNNLIALCGYEPARKARLTCQLLNSAVRPSESDVRIALDHCHRDPAALVDTTLLTRLVAALWRLANDPAPVDALMSLLELSTEEATGLATASTPASETDPDGTHFTRLLMLANLQTTMLALAKAHSGETALDLLAGTLLNAPARRVFMQSGEYWRNGKRQIRSSLTLVGRAAAAGRPANLQDHAATLVDEELQSELQCEGLVAIPVLMDASPESCACVILAGYNGEPPPDASVTGFQMIARNLLNLPAVESISLDALDARLREIIHEANNPLSTVLNYLKILSLKLGEAHEAQPTLSSITDEIERVGSIIRSFHQVGHMDPVTQSSDVMRILRRLIRLNASAHPGIQFSLDEDDTEPKVIMADSALQQVMTNLLKNAIEALADNTDATIHIVVRSSIHQGSAICTEISVMDNGPGIPASVGDPFQLGHTSKDAPEEHHTPGVPPRGEGLAVVRRLVNQAGGTISYRSSPTGTEFRLSLPQGAEEDSNTTTTDKRASHERAD